jgi:hypothetical protein
MNGTVGAYTADQVEAIRRQVVETCAKVADGFKRHTLTEWPDYISAEIRAMLGEDTHGA